MQQMWRLKENWSAIGGFSLYDAGSGPAARGGGRRCPTPRALRGESFLRPK